MLNFWNDHFTLIMSMVIMYVLTSSGLQFKSCQHLFYTIYLTCIVTTFGPGIHPPLLHTENKYTWDSKTTKYEPCSCISRYKKFVLAACSRVFWKLVWLQAFSSFLFFFQINLFLWATTFRDIWTLWAQSLKTPLLFLLMIEIQAVTSYRRSLSVEQIEMWSISGKKP